MDKELIVIPELDKEFQKLITTAESVYNDNFEKTAWFGRCIFLSWYCERGTCTFCFRSTQKHKIQHAEKARRSLASVLAEAMLIKGLGWRLEFLTGGYGICDDQELVRMVKLVHQVLKEKLWINLGEIGSEMLHNLQPYVEGVVSSIETVEPSLHTQVCPDKPIGPYVEMMKSAKDLGFKISMTVVIGLGEKREHIDLLKEFITDNSITRITVYALRPVANTPFTKGPDPLDVAWWIAQLRISFPTLEIIAGSAQYRIPELHLLLKAGANAITKLPATNIFNTDKGKQVEEQVRLAGRTFSSMFTCNNLSTLQDWGAMLDGVDITADEKKDVLILLQQYLKKMSTS